VLERIPKSVKRVSEKMRGSKQTFGAPIWFDQVGALIGFRKEIVRSRSEARLAVSRGQNLPALY